MKLYATTTSERASKGQGGNKELIVSIIIDRGGGREEIGKIMVVNGEEKITIFSSIPETTPLGQGTHYWKGKKQKDENI